jgi:hypothetical protein
LLVGASVDHYDARAEARALGIVDRVTIAGFVPNEEVADYLAASDICLCMRWPSSHETSAAWLRCLAAGRATVITDLEHLVDIPALDPRTWTLLHVPRAGPDEEGSSDDPVEPVSVSIDLLDEEQSLKLAIHRLATNARLRERLGRRARRLWTERFTLDQMVSSYLDVLDKACAAPPADAIERSHLPPHFLTDGTERATRMLRLMGMSEPRIAAIWT